MVIPWSFESNKGYFSSALEHWVVSGVDNRDDLGSQRVRSIYIPTLRNSILPLVDYFHRVRPCMEPVSPLPLHLSSLRSTAVAASRNSRSLVKHNTRQTIEQP